MDAAGLLETALARRGGAGVSDRLATAQQDTGYIRPIDGLRALAVLAVILYHLGTGWIPGGFIGVDIFFAISGFVVARSVSGRTFPGIASFFSYFYARRIVRILPALLLCLLVTVLLTCMFIPYAWLSEPHRNTALAAFLGFSNFFLAFNSDNYFFPRSEFNPFTHTWSLGVEEQFYFVFPLLFFAFVWIRANPATRLVVIAAFALISVVSLAYCRLAGQTYPQYAFYLIFARFWELGAGVLLSATGAVWLPWMRRLPPAAVAALAGLAMLALAAAFAGTDPQYFPFPWALAPVAATLVLIALFAAGRVAGLAAALSSPVATYLGSRSYSLYLWHWPAFVLFRWTVGLEGPAPMFAASATTFLVAEAAYRYVERPIRRAPLAKRAPRWAVVLAGVACAVGGWYAAGRLFDLKPQLSLSVTRDRAIWSPDGMPATGRCPVTQDFEPMGAGGVYILSPKCPGAQALTQLFVAGDSHAGAYLSMMRHLASDRGYAVRLYSAPGCGSFNMRTPNAMAGADCAGFSQLLMADLLARARPGDVLFLSSLRVPRVQDQWGFVAAPPDVPAWVEAMRVKVVDEAREALAPLAARGVTVVFEAPKPIFLSPPFRCSDWFNSANPICRGGFEVPRRAMEDYRGPVMETLRLAAAAVPSAIVWDPLPVLCGSDICSAYRDGKPLYFDGDHVSGNGNAVLYPAFVDMLARLKDGKPS